MGLVMVTHHSYVTHHDHHPSAMCSFRSNLIDISSKLGQGCKSYDHGIDIDI